MEKVKKFFRQKSIKKAYAASMLACIFASLLLAFLLSELCQMAQSGFCRKHLENLGVTNLEMNLSEEEFASMDPEKIAEKLGVADSRLMLEFEQAGQGNYKVIVTYGQFQDFWDQLTDFEGALYNIIGILSVGVYPISFILCIAATSVLFYRRQLQKPLALLGQASRQIAENNLDFKIDYGKEDEMGQLCASFEKMRQALWENNEEMWRQMEERRRLNAAFSHDMRTPLTVLRGQSELLLQYAPKMSPQKLRSTSEMLHRHIVRLEDYVQAMSDLQRLEDIEVSRQPIALGSLYRQIQETGKALCAPKACSCHMEGEADASLSVDAAIVLRVFENLLANGARYAKEEVAVSLTSQDGCLYLAVADDGPGFAKKDLENATKPFYKTVQETDKEHFGMGLNICKVLCEKHGGCLTLGNRCDASAMGHFFPSMDTGTAAAGCAGSGAIVTAAFRQALGDGNRNAGRALYSALL